MPCPHFPGIKTETETHREQVRGDLTHTAADKRDKRAEGRGGRGARGRRTGVSRSVQVEALQDAGTHRENSEDNGVRNG